MNTEDLLKEALKKKVFPGACLFVGKDEKLLFRCAVGYSKKIPYCVSVKEDTIFDLASLTKPFATAFSIMKLVDDGILDLDMPISEIIPTPKEKRKITIRMLLSHSSGLPSWRPYYLKLQRYPLRERKRITLEWILKEELLFPPGKDILYSDLGFILLEAAVEAVSKKKMKFFLEDIYRKVPLKDTFLSYPEKKIHRDRFAATEFCPWRKRIIQGEVHDENAWAIGGSSGHSGLFSTAEDLFLLSKLLLDHYSGKREDFFKRSTVEEFFRKQNKRWTLGWDTPTDRSSCGRFFSEKSVGHLGFTGTSVWIDLEKKAIVIFLTNRIHPTRRNEKIKLFRPILHEQVIREFFL